MRHALVGRFCNAVYLVDWPGSMLPGRHESRGKYTKSGDEWTAPNPQTGGKFTLTREDRPDGSTHVTRWTSYKKGDQEFEQPAEHFIYNSPQAADTHLAKRFGI